MKVIVVHGDHTEKSYERIAKFIDVAKKRGWKIERLSGKDTENLPEVLSSASLFNEQRLFIVEEVAKTPKKQLEWIKTRAKDLSGNLVIFNEGHLADSVLKHLPKPDKTEVFKYPKIIYKFMESFYPGNAETCLKILYSFKERNAAEYILAVLSGHLRDVYIVKLDEKALDYPGWRVSKLKKQAEKYDEIKLKQVIASLSEADFLSKTTTQAVYDSLDLIIATQLE